MSRKKHKKDGLESKVMKFRPQRDDDGEYIPYCTFGYHMGIVLRTYVCESRKCNHYRKYYIGSIGRLEVTNDGQCYRQGQDYSEREN